MNHLVGSETSSIRQNRRCGRGRLRISLDQEASMEPTLAQRTPALCAARPQ